MRAWTDLAVLLALGTSLTAGAQPRAITVRAHCDWQRIVWGDSVGAGGLHVVDLDADGQNDVLARTTLNPYNSNGTWIVMRHDAGWYPVVTHGPTYDAYVSAVRPADLDADGRPEIVVASGSRIFVYDGADYAPRGDFPTLAGTIRGLNIVDVDADGDVEFVFCDVDGLYVCGPGGALEFAGPGLGGWDAAVGNVDADPALEITVAGGDGPGYVVDALTHAVEWTRPDGFGTVIRCADVDADGRDELVAGGWWFRVAVFDAVQREIQYEIPTLTSGVGLCLAEVTGDAVPDVLWGASGDLQVHDGPTGAFLWAVNTFDYGLTGPAVGDCDDDGVLEVLWGTGGSSGPDHLHVASTATHELEWRSADIHGPFYALDAGDVDADGRTELLYACYESEAGLDGLWHVHDGGSKALEYVSPPPAAQSGLGLWRLAHANVDADPAAEIFVPASYTDFGRLQCIDGVTHTLQWYRDLLRGQMWVALAAADLDGDGAVEIIGASARAHSGGTGDYVHIYTGFGNYVWQSDDLGFDQSPHYYLRLANVDADPQLEILAGEQIGQLSIIDGLTHEFELQTADLDLTGLDALDLDGDGLAEVLVATAFGGIFQLDPMTGDPVALLGDAGGPIEGFDVARPAPDVPPLMAYCIAGELRLHAVGGSVLWHTGGLPPAAGAHDSVRWLDIDDDGSPELLVNAGFALGCYEVVASAGGDLNCDGVVTYADVNPFVLALVDRAQYEQAFSNCPWEQADCNGDDLVNFDDINTFAALLGS